MRSVWRLASLFAGYNAVNLKVRNTLRLPNGAHEAYYELVAIANSAIQATRYQSLAI